MEDVNKHYVNVIVPDAVEKQTGQVRGQSTIPRLTDGSAIGHDPHSTTHMPTLRNWHLSYYSQVPVGLTQALSLTSLLPLCAALLGWVSVFAQVMRKLKKAHESFDIENAKIKKRYCIRLPTVPLPLP